MAEKLKFIVEVDSATGVARMRDVKAAEEGLTDSIKRQDKATKGLNSTFKTMIGVMGSLVAGYTLKGLASDLLDAARSTENYKTRLKVLLGTVEEGNRLFKEMSAYAGAVPFEFEAIMESATQLSGIMKGGVDEIKAWMPLIGDLAAASGFDIKTTTEQVIRMYSTGAASADLFRERGVLAMMGFQAGVSYSADETRKKMVEAWQEVDSKFRGATKEMAATWDGMTSMVSDKWFRLRNLIMEAGVFDELKTQLGEVNELFGDWIEMNDALLRQEVPKFIEDTKTALKSIWDIVSYDPAIIEYGIVGLAFGGKKGAVLLGSMAHMKTWAENLAKALGMASAGVLGFKEIATANFKELEELVRAGESAMQGPYYRGKIPARGNKSSGISPGESGVGEDYYKGISEDWLKVTSDFEEMEKELHQRRTEYFSQALGDWNAVSQEFYNAEYERDRLQAESFLAIRDEMRMEDLDRLQAVMDAETQIIGQAMRQQEGMEARKAEIAGIAWKGGLDNVEFALREFGKKSKTAFTAFKAVAIANTIIATYSAAQKSYDAMADIPYVGPALGAAAAAAAIAAGMARVSAIQSTTADGGGAVGTYSASPTTGLPTSTASTPAPVTPGPGQGQPGVYIHIEGDSINDEEYLERWAERISDMVENRDVFLMASNSQVAEQLA
jgi:hypothetical protein